MALTTCPDCGNSISDAAQTCIHCGRPMRGDQPAPDHTSEVRKGVQRSKLRRDIGNAIGLVGVMAGVAAGAVESAAAGVITFLVIGAIGLAVMYL